MNNTLLSNLYLNNYELESTDGSVPEAAVGKGLSQRLGPH